MRARSLVSVMRRGHPKNVPVDRVRIVNRMTGRKRTYLGKGELDVRSARRHRSLLDNFGESWRSTEEGLVDVT